MNVEISRDTLTKLYVNQNLTDAEIAEKFSVNPWNISRLRKELGIAGINARQREFLRRPAASPLAQRQHSVIMGTLLGDGCLKPSGDRAYLSIGHSEKQKEYIFWLYEELKTICPNQPRQEIHHGKYVMHVLTTETRFDLAEMRNGLYTPQKVATEKFFGNLDELGLAIWYMDDGGLNYVNKSKLNFSLATNGYSESEQVVLKNILMNNFGISAELSPTISQTGKKQFCLVVSDSSFDLFSSVVRKNLIPSMEHKLPGDAMSTAMLNRSKTHISKFELEHLYVDEKMTQSQIAIKLGVSPSTIRKHMSLMKIEERNTSDAQLGGKNSRVKKDNDGRFVSVELGGDEEAMARGLFAEIRREGIKPKTIDCHHAIGIIERLFALPVEQLFDGEGVAYSRVAVELCTAFFPHIIEMASRNSKSPTQLFNDDDALMDCIRRTIRYAKRATLASVRQGLKTYKSNRSVTIFPPVWAKYATQYVMKGRTECNVLDFSCGFGGRFLGTYGSGLVSHYVGIDPLGKNIASNIELGHIIDHHSRISSKAFSYEFICGRAEDEIEKLEKKFDLVITCPPYFDKEIYADDQSQCYLKFDEYGKWVGEWMTPVIKSAFLSLSDNGAMVIFASNWGNCQVGDDCARIMKEVSGLDVECVKFFQPTLEYLRKTGAKKVETAWIIRKTSNPST